MSHTMKIYERILERRVRGETLVGDEQFGFMPGRSTTDAIFALRQMLEKYGEKQSYTLSSLIWKKRMIECHAKKFGLV